MTKYFTLNSRRAATGGFTLVEMLVVSALIAIFAGLAVFNITAQLEREKAKAAVAEARNIATAMSFAYSDLGFFPKICLLRFNYDNLTEAVKGMGFTVAEYHSYPVGNLPERLRTQWKHNYLAGSGPDKNARVRWDDAALGGPTPYFDWPGDPWGNPYVAYLLATIPGQTANGAPGTPKQEFISSAGQKANYFAGIVSYARNRAPGLKDIPGDAAKLQERLNARLYREDGRPLKEWRLLRSAEYNSNPELVKMLVGGATPDPDFPHIREEGSDDRFYEF